jgi:glycosyltransferase involved in cell wall biosynthesis
LDRAVTAPRLRIAFVLAELTLGGAEMMLWKLISRMDRARFDPVVISLSSRSDAMTERFRALGIDCRFLGMRSRADVSAFYRLIAVLREAAPDVVQGWMYYGNLASTFASAFLGRRPPVLWNIRGSLNLAQEKRLSVFVIWLGGKMSFLPTRIINNSEASAIEHERRLGYRTQKRVILPNGFDTETFVPSAAARTTLRKMLGLRDDNLLIGLIGRYHPMKDHDTFLRAAVRVGAQHPEVHYVLAGENVDAANRELCARIRAYDLAQRVHLLGMREDMPEITAGLDISASSSCGGEGFPNVIGEAMSCAVPCVVTDVGSSAWVVGDTGLRVPPRDPAGLAQAMVAMIEMAPEARAALGRRARERVVGNFALDAVVRRYEQLYEQVHVEAGN